MIRWLKRWIAMFFDMKMPAVPPPKRSEPDNDRRKE